MGLSIFPDFDKEIINEQKEADKEACLIYGFEKQNPSELKCTNCGNNYFIKAIKE